MQFYGQVHYRSVGMISGLTGGEAKHLRPLVEQWLEDRGHDFDDSCVSSKDNDNYSIHVFFEYSESYLPDKLEKYVKKELAKIQPKKKKAKK